MCLTNVLTNVAKTDISVCHDWHQRMQISVCTEIELVCGRVAEGGYCEL